MDTISGLFFKPVQIMTFWASTKTTCYIITSTTSSLEAQLAVDEPKVGTWAFQVFHGDGTPFIGDYIEPYLPTRKNISIMNAGCVNACKILAEYKADLKNYVIPEASMFPNIEAYHGPIRNLNDSEYQRAFSQVLLSDWGVALPKMSRLGQDDIILTYRQGLPCAAAMSRGLQPIFEAFKGPLIFARASVSKAGDRVFDTLDYHDNAGTPFSQRFDITDLYGKNLPYTQFRFESGEVT